MAQDRSQSFRLPVIELSPDRSTQARLVGWVHGARIILLLLLLVGLHRLADFRSLRSGASAPVAIDLPIALMVDPDVSTVEAIDGDPTAYKLFNSAGEDLGIVTQTSPHSDSIVGYAGPSNVLIVMNNDLIVQSVRLLRCPDTADHLRMVENKEKYWQQFIGWKWGETANVTVDGVTGATLTSLAIAEAVAWRLSHPPGAASEPVPQIRKSLRFSNPLSVDSLGRWFESVTDVRDEVAFPFLVECLDESGIKVGLVVRTGPLNDTVIGYQGPTEVILQVERSAPDSAGDPGDALIVVDAMLGESFDNQPYVNYVKQERSFWKRFRNRSVESLAAMDFDAEMIDGVSGATMTSMAVAETIRNACRKWLEIEREKTLAAAKETPLADQPKDTMRRRTLNASWTEWLTGIIALAAIFWSRSRFRGRWGWRIAWQATVLISIGWLSGNLLSLALLGGWTRGGVAWHFAPGLAILAGVALLAPAIMKGNLYCDHICPHGILQQWIRPRKGRNLTPILKVTMRISAVTFVLVALIAVVQPGIANLAWFEPFDAYATGVWMSLSAAIWGISLVLSRIIPMGYCRLACPTGRLLDYTRRDASRHQLTLADATLLVGTLAVWLTPMMLSHLRDSL